MKATEKFPIQNAALSDSFLAVNWPPTTTQASREADGDYD